MYYSFVYTPYPSIFWATYKSSQVISSNLLTTDDGPFHHAAGRNAMGWGWLRVKNVLVEEIERWLHGHAFSADIIRIEELLR